MQVGVHPVAPAGPGRPGLRVRLLPVPVRLVPEGLKGRAQARRQLWGQAKFLGGHGLGSVCRRREGPGRRPHKGQRGRILKIVGHVGALHHHDIDGPLGGVYPGGRSPGAGMAEAPRREEVRDAAARCAHYRHPKAPAKHTVDLLLRVSRRKVARGHRRQGPVRPRAEIAAAVKHAAVEQHPAESRVVARGREKAAVAQRDGFAPPRDRSVCRESLLEDELAGPGVRPVAAGEAEPLLVARVERGVPHAEGVEDALLEKGVEGLPGDGLDKEAPRH